MWWTLDQLSLLIFVGITTYMMATTAVLASSNTLSQFNGFGGELQCMAQLPLSELLRIKQTLQLISNVTVDGTTRTHSDAISARSDTIDRTILRDRFNRFAAAAVPMEQMLTPMPYIGGRFR